MSGTLKASSIQEPYKNFPIVSLKIPDSHKIHEYVKKYNIVDLIYYIAITIGVLK